MDKIRWGIISTGNIAQQFAADFNYVKNGTIEAVASRSLESAQKFSRQYGIPKAYGSYNELIDDKEIDAIYVATPHNLHLKNSSDAINAGKAVLCEKPLTLNPKESRQLIDLARAKNRFLMEALWTYFLPAVQKARQWVNEGRIGEIIHIKSDFGFFQGPYHPQKRLYNTELGGGCLLDMGIYPVAFAWLFSKEDPLEIKSFAKRAPNGVEDDLNVLYRYKNKTAVIGTSFRGKLPNLGYIIGEDGYISLPDFWQAKECFLYKDDACVDHYNDGRKSIGLNYETEAFNADLLAGRTESEVMPHAYSQKLQEHMAAIFNTI